MITAPFASASGAPASSTGAPRCGSSRSVMPQPLQLRVLQKNNRLAVGDLAPLDHGQRFCERKFQYLDILALIGLATASRNAIGWRIVGNEQRQSFADAARAHVRVEDPLHRPQAIPEFLFGFLADRCLRIVLVEQPRARLYQHAALGRPWPGVYIDRHAELAHQQHRAALGVDRQDGRAVAAVVDLPDLRLPDAIAPLQLYRVLGQPCPIVGKQRLADDAHAFLSAHSPLTPRRNTRSSVAFARSK